MVQMYLSTLGTCSSLAEMLSIMPSCLRLFLRHSNFPLASICMTLNPLALYVLIICLCDVIMVIYFYFYHLYCSEIYIRRRCNYEQYDFDDLHDI